jgi:hypothetical protein
VCRALVKRRTEAGPVCRVRARRRVRAGSAPGPARRAPTESRQWVPRHAGRTNPGARNAPMRQCQPAPARPVTGAARWSRSRRPAAPSQPSQAPRLPLRRTIPLAQPRRSGPPAARASELSGGRRRPGWAGAHGGAGLRPAPRAPGATGLGHDATVSSFISSSSRAAACLRIGINVISSSVVAGASLLRTCNMERQSILVNEVNNSKV